MSKAPTWDDEMVYPVLLRVIEKNMSIRQAAKFLKTTPTAVAFCIVAVVQDWHENGQLR